MFWGRISVKKLDVENEILDGGAVDDVEDQARSDCSRGYDMFVCGEKTCCMPSDRSPSILTSGVTSHSVFIPENIAV
jgi:hypothetical protein